jgi:hypothetical protein
MDNKNLIDKILEASSIIHKSSLRGPASYIVTSSQTAQMIQEVFSENRSNWRKEKINKIFNE